VKVETVIALVAVVSAFAGVLITLRHDRKMRFFEQRKNIYMEALDSMCGIALPLIQKRKFSSEWHVKALALYDKLLIYASFYVLNSYAKFYEAINFEDDQALSALCAMPEEELSDKLLPYIKDFARAVYKEVHPKKDFRLEKDDMAKGYFDLD
jgi:hypothetical protein